MSRVLFGALLLVLALSPFEAGYPPLGRVLWATFTNLEVILFVLAGAYLVTLVRDGEARRRLLRLPLLWPIVALVGASVVSTIFGEYKSLGVQFIYRLLMGVVVYAAAWEVLRGRRRLLTGLFVFVGAGLVAALIGLLEFAPSLNIQPILRAFKPQATTVGGMLRLSGTFEYANGAAMYFEMALPVLVSLAMLFSSRRLIADLFGERSVPESNRRGVLALLYVGVGVYMMALILTFSRAALGGVLVALAVFGVMAIVRRRTKDEGRRTKEITNYELRITEENPKSSKSQSVVIWRSLAITAGVMVAGGVLVFLTQPMFRLRLLTENDLDWYRAAVIAEPLPDLAARQLITVPVSVRNDGRMVWPAGGVLPVHVSYHWMSATENVYLVFDGLRSGLPHDVAPGETVPVLAIVQAPPRPGNYRLQWDLVHETVTWFDRKQGVQGEIRAYTISEALAVGSQHPPASTMPPPVDVLSIADTTSIERTRLWRVALAMFLDHPITGVGPDGFRNLYGRYAGVTDWNRNIYTNNTYIEMFANLGLLGGLSFLWLAGLALWRAGRDLLRAPTGPVWLLGIGATAALVAFFAHGVVDYFLFSTPIYVIFWFLLAASARWHEA
jgi:hypothetical protein